MYIREIKQQKKNISPATSCRSIIEQASRQENERGQLDPHEWPLDPDEGRLDPHTCGGRPDFCQIRHMPSPLHQLDPTGRFSSRANNYAKYRPSYPPELIAFLEEHLGLRKGRMVADIGSGTGIFTELLLLKGAQVTGVEPNTPMRQSAEQRLGAYERFYSLDGRAEQTGLADQTVDLITVAQAFHWIDPIAAKQEFARILRPGGHIALIWNIRLQHSPFLRDYEDFLREFGRGYDAANRIEEPVLREFFRPAAMELRVFPQIRLMDEETLKGLVFSASYMPAEGDPRYSDMLYRLEGVFSTHQESGIVRMEYETRLYYNAFPAT